MSLFDQIMRTWEERTSVDATMERLDAGDPVVLGDKVAFKVADAYVLMDAPDPFEPLITFTPSFAKSTIPSPMPTFSALSRFGMMAPKIKCDIPRPAAPSVEALLRDGWAWTGWEFSRERKPDFGLPMHVLVEEPVLDENMPVFVRTVAAGPKRKPGMYRTDDAGGEAKCVPYRWVTPSWRGWGGAETARIIATEAFPPARMWSSCLKSSRVLSGRYDDRLPTNRQRKRERAKQRRAERLRGDS